jgi:hypothetical protein
MTCGSAYALTDTTVRAGAAGRCVAILLVGRLSMSRLLLALLIVFGLFGVLLGAFGYWISGPERMLQDKDFTPDGLTVVRVDFPSDPNIMRYDPDRISEEQLREFARELCRNDIRKITAMTPTLLDKLRGQERTMIACN